MSYVRPSILVVCDFCKKTFKKDKSRHKRSPTPCCKDCNRISGVYNKQNLSSDKHEFYLEFELKKSKFSHHPSSKKGHVDLICPFCREPYSIRLDSLLIKKSDSCKRCLSICNQYLSCGSSMDKVEFRSAILDKYGVPPSDRLHCSIFSGEPLSCVCDFCHSGFQRPLTHFGRNRQHSSISCNSCLGFKSSYDKLGLSIDKYGFRKTMTSDNFSEDIIHRTLLSFNYDPSTLMRSSKNLIVCDCVFCGAEMNFQIRSFFRSGGRPSCSSCRRQKLKESLMKKYGVPTINMIPSVLEKFANPSTNRLVEHLLKDRYKIEFVREHPIMEYQFDFYIPSLNLLIECQGDYFHNFKENGYSGTPRDRGKATYIKEYTNYKLIHIWEHEINLGRITKILDFNIYKIKEPEIHIQDIHQITFRKITYDDARPFLASYHYLDPIRNSSTCYGAFISDTLICVSVFGGLTRNQSIKKMDDSGKLNSGNVRELKRFCIRPNVICKNLASFCLSRFSLMLKSDVSVSALLSFSDSTVGDLGTIYKACNWSRLGDTASSYHYLDPQSGRSIHKKTVWDAAKKMVMPESSFASKVGLFKVPELPKSVWLKHL